MLLMQQPPICPKCGQEMCDYYENARTKKLVFTCPGSHILEVTKSEYLERIRSQNRNRE